MCNFLLLLKNYPYRTYIKYNYQIQFLDYKTAHRDIEKLPDSILEKEISGVVLEAPSSIVFAAKEIRQGKNVRVQKG